MSKETALPAFYGTIHRLISDLAEERGITAEEFVARLRVKDGKGR